MLYDCSLMRTGFRRSFGLLGSAVLLLACWAPAQSQTPREPAASTVRPLVLLQTQYRLRAGDRVSIAASQETLQFIRAAKTLNVTINGICAALMRWPSSGTPVRCLLRVGKCSRDAVHAVQQRDVGHRLF